MQEDTVKPSDPDWYVFKGISMSDKEYEDIEAAVLKSYPNACILYVDQLINPNLEEKYQARYAELVAKRHPNPIKELRLFHGTKHSNINNIARTGFLTQFNKTSAFGIGTYFSTVASYSKDFMDADKESVSYMFLCDVLVGNITQTRGYTDIDTTKYDNSVDNMTKPTIYVSPYDDGCIPRFLVAFHKNAK